MVFVISNCSSENTSSDKAINNTITPAPVTQGDWYKPDSNATWQWQLQGALNTGYDVDIYDVDLADTPQATINDLHAAGKHVICYFSAGSYEDFRDDAANFDEASKGKTLDGFANERWLDIRSANVINIMKARLVLAKEKKCDGVEPDNMDGYLNDTGFALTANDQLSFNKLIANAAHSMNLSVGLKNDLDQIAELVSYYDFSVNEQCHEYNECATLTPFINMGKPVFNAEYLDSYVNNASIREQMCVDSISLKLTTLVLPLDLDDSFRFSCL